MLNKSKNRSFCGPFYLQVRHRYDELEKQQPWLNLAATLAEYSILNEERSPFGYFRG
jgi:hypothetical protein